MKENVSGCFSEHSVCANSSMADLSTIIASGSWTSNVYDSVKRRWNDTIEEINVDSKAEYTA